MKTYTQEELKVVLAAHALWLSSGRAEGQRANLTNANLRGANLRGANLRGANLRDANLIDANLRDANLSGADLRDANLIDANLRDANLIDANLRGADLRDANLSGANLIDANLRDANLSGADLPGYALCPQEGEFVAFKKLQGGVIAKLKIPADAARTSSLVGRKCRAEYAVVLELTGGETGLSKHDRKTQYLIGQEVRPDKFDPDIRVECTNGIHFFITREEAEQY